MTEHHHAQTTPSGESTDKLFEFVFHTKKGRLNHPKLKQVAFLIYVSSLFMLYNGSAFAYHLYYNSINICYYYDSFLHQTALYLTNWVTEIQIYGIEKLLTQETLIMSVLLVVPFTPVISFIMWVRKKARIQANLASVGLEHYYLKSVDKKSNIYIFKLLTGYKMSYDTFIHEFENLKQLFGEGDIAYKRYKSDMVQVHFKDTLIDIDTIKKSTKNNFSLSKHIQPNKLLLGATSLDGHVLYATNKEEGNGLLNGHWLIVGSSGSGKSVSVKSFCMNFLLPHNYQHIDDIFIINYKQSSDYNFVKPLNKVSYAQDIKEGLKLLKQIQLNMFNKYLYNTEHNQDNFTSYQTLVIIDEIQTLSELLDSKSLHKIERNSIQESLSIIEMLGSKARASNISLPKTEYPDTQHV